MIKVHGVHGSPFVRKVLIGLRIKGIEYEQVQQMPFARDEQYQKINPLGKIPTLEDGDFVLCDSKVICRYLDAAYPDVPLYPADEKQKALADWYEELGGSTLSELGAGIFFQRFMKPMAFKQEPDEALIEKIITKQLPPILDYLESQVPEQGFIFGDFGMADLAIVSPLINAGYAGYAVDAERWPKFAAFAERVKAQPEVAGILEAEAQALGLN
ncbi:MAG: glutathione S-transferase family protein [Halioglobus sp.]|nr:glutathione S-transferase family protein [Halioglobus sp.]